MMPRRAVHLDKIDGRFKVCRDQDGDLIDVVGSRKEIPNFPKPGF